MAWFELIGGALAALVGGIVLVGAAKSDGPLEQTGNWALAGLVAGIVGCLFFIMGALSFIAVAVFA